jgi:MiaB/RimO family radical SAM methylthiotransferase/LynF/TruF/PatF family peptide O-prenyltransferase
MEFSDKNCKNFAKIKFYLETIECCPSRTLDAEQIKNYFIENKCEQVLNPEIADVIIINTCANLEQDENLYLKKIEKYKKIIYKKPDKKIIVTGCLKGVRSDICIDNENLYYLGPSEIEKIDSLFPEFKKFNTICYSGECINIFDKYGFVNFKKPQENKDKWFVETSSGCDKQIHCSYCTIWKGIGAFKSKPLKQCIEEIKIGIKKGHKTIHLVDYGAYGIDIGSSFPELLNLICEIEEIENIVLQGVNVYWLIKYITELEAIVKTGKIKTIRCAHQSGSDRILELMNRRYSAEDSTTVVKRLKQSYPALNVITQIIVGFPTETEEDFKETLNLIKEAKIDYVDGPFLFSPRKGTHAYEYEKKGKISDSVKTDRKKRIGNLIKKIRNVNAYGKSDNVEIVDIEKIEKEDIENGLTIFIESKCNCKCSFCMLKNVMPELKTLSLQEFKKTVDDKLTALQGKKYKRIILSGAEISLNSQLNEMAEYCRKKGFEKIQIQTNGIKLKDKEYCLDLINAGVNEFLITLLADSSAVHDQLTNILGSFEKTIKGIRNLASENVTIAINIVITKQNYKLLEKIVKLAVSIGGIDQIHFWNYWPMSKDDKEDHLVSVVNQKKYLIDSINLCDNQGILPIVRYYPACLISEKTQNISNCLAETLIDKTYWNEFKENEFNCIYSENCEYYLQKKCKGFPLAYIKKFGWEEKIIKPLKIEDGREHQTQKVQDEETRQKIKYLMHKKKFQIKDDPVLKKFELLMSKSKKYHLECSCKFSEGKIYPVRFNIWYKDQNQKVLNLNNALRFIKKIFELENVKINYSILKQIMDEKFDIEKVHQIIVGIDLRSNRAKSRLKIWFIIKNQSKKIKQVLKISKIDIDQNKIFYENMKTELLFGIDFSFDGTTKLKIYPFIKNEDLLNKNVMKTLENEFSGKIMKLIQNSDGFHVSYNNKNKDIQRILHLTTYKYDYFIDIMNNKKIEKMKEIILQGKKLGSMIISFPEDEINQGINNFNIYY